MKWLTGCTFLLLLVYSAPVQSAPPQAGFPSGVTIKVAPSYFRLVAEPGHVYQISVGQGEPDRLGSLNCFENLVLVTTDARFVSATYRWVDVGLTELAYPNWGCVKWETGDHIGYDAQQKLEEP